MDLKQWCRNQAEEAKKYKWIKGVELGKDPGDKAIIEWIEKYAKIYRSEYKVCFEQISKKVSEAVKPKLPDIDEEKLRHITDLIIEEFTKQWIKESAIDVKHIEEI
jgi:hypothetical protein